MSFVSRIAAEAPLTFWRTEAMKCAVGAPGCLVANDMGFARCPLNLVSSSFDMVPGFTRLLRPLSPHATYSGLELLLRLPSLLLHDRPDLELLPLLDRLRRRLSFFFLLCFLSFFLRPGEERRDPPQLRLTFLSFFFLLSLPKPIFSASTARTSSAMSSSLRPAALAWSQWGSRPGRPLAGLRPGPPEDELRRAIPPGWRVHPRARLPPSGEAARPPPSPQGSGTRLPVVPTRWRRRWTYFASLTIWFCCAMFGVHLRIPSRGKHIQFTSARAAPGGAVRVGSVVSSRWNWPATRRIHAHSKRSPSLEAV